MEYNHGNSSIILLFLFFTCINVFDSCYFICLLFVSLLLPIVWDYIVLLKLLLTVLQNHFLCIGCYGDVLRVKILYNKKDSALIQFAEPFQAHSGMCV